VLFHIEDLTQGRILLREGGRLVFCMAVQDVNTCITKLKRKWTAAMSVAVT